MTHEQIAADDVIDRYVRDDLDAGSKEAFEEHYFACDECFARVQELEQLRGAVRQAVNAGTLRSDVVELKAQPDGVRDISAPRATPVATWLQMAALVAMAAGLSWMTLVKVPALQTEIDATREESSRLKTALDAAANKPLTPIAAVVPNVAMVTLSAERGVESSSTLTLKADAVQFVVVIDAPNSSTGQARLELLGAADSALILSVSALERRTDGLWTVSVPASQFADGTYRLRLYEDAPRGRLLGEYLLKIGRAKR